MDNGSGRHVMAETVYGTEDTTMVMSEKVKIEKSIKGGEGEGKKITFVEKGKEKSEKSKKLKLNNFYHMLLYMCPTSTIGIRLHFRILVDFLFFLSSAALVPNSCTVIH